MDRFLFPFVRNHMGYIPGYIANLLLRTETAVFPGKMTSYVRKALWAKSELGTSVSLPLL